MQRKRRKLASIAFPLLLGVSIFGCGSNDSVGQEYKQVLRLRTGPERFQAMRQKSYCRQIDIYLYGMNRRPPYNLAHYVAGNGKDILPVLLDRLEKDPDEGNQQALIFVVEAMAIQDPTVKEDKEMIERLRKKIDSMAGFHREQAEKSLQGILQPGRQSRQE